MTQAGEGFGGDTDPEFFKRLEAEFPGADQAAVAVVNRDLAQQATNLSEVVAASLPAGLLDQFEPIRRLSYATNGQLAEDGYPLIIGPADAYLVAKERPDIAEIMARKAHYETSAERQQLALDLRVVEGDEVATEKLLAAKAALDSRADRIEFWSAVALLHPFDQASLEPYHSGIRWSAHDFDSRVMTLMGIERESNLLNEQIKDLSTGYLDAYEKEHGGDPEQKTWVEQTRKLYEQNVVKIDKYSRLLTDICNGHLTVADDNIEIKKPDSAMLSPAETTLKNLPGADPIKLIHNEMLHKIPREGWLIAANVTPDSKGGFQIYRYKSGAFKVSSVHYSEQFGSGGAFFSFQPDRYGQASVSYHGKGAEYNYRGTQTSAINNQTIPVADKMEIQHTFLPMREEPNGLSRAIRTSSIDESASLGKAQYDIARVTGSPEEAQTIIGELCTVMGIAPKDMAQLLEALTVRDVFGGLRPLTGQERIERERLIARRSPAEPKYAPDFNPYEG